MKNKKHKWAEIRGFKRNKEWTHFCEHCGTVTSNHSYYKDEFGNLSTKRPKCK